MCSNVASSSTRYTLSLHDALPILAAVSAGFVKGELVLDLEYAEDSIADADVNVVATSDGELIEVQGTAEGRPFSRADFDRVLELSLKGIAQLIEAQRQALKQTKTAARA